jgi:hypothetical protein
VHVLLVERAVKDLGVAAAAVDVLLVLHCELDDQWLVLVRELLEVLRQGVELGVLAGLDALVLVGVAVELARGPRELAQVILVLGLHPLLLPIS